MVDFQSRPVQNPLNRWFYNPIQSKFIWIGLDFQSGGLIQSIQYSGTKWKPVQIHFLWEQIQRPEAFCRGAPRTCSRWPPFRSRHSLVRHSAASALGRHTEGYTTVNLPLISPPPLGLRGSSSWSGIRETWSDSTERIPMGSSPGSWMVRGTSQTLTSRAPRGAPVANPGFLGRCGWTPSCWNQ